MDNKKKSQSRGLNQVTWESKVPHKAPLPQHSLTHKHKEHLLDSQFKQRVRINTSKFAL